MGNTRSINKLHTKTDTSFNQKILSKYYSHDRSIYINKAFELYGSDVYTIFEKKHIILETNEVPTIVINKIIEDDNGYELGKLLLFIKYKRDYILSSYNETTLFDYMCSHNKFNCINICIDELDIGFINTYFNKKWIDGQTLMHFACDFHCYDLIEKLFSFNNALIFDQDIDGFTPFDIFFISWYKNNYIDYEKQIKIIKMFKNINLNQILNKIQVGNYYIDSTYNSNELHNLQHGYTFWDIINSYIHYETNEERKAVLRTFRQILFT